MSDVNRRAGRTDLEVDVEVAAAEEVHGGTTKNIGLGGVFLATPRLHAVGERVVLKFTLPGESEPIAVEGEVRWVRPSASHDPAHPAGMGLRFVNMAYDRSILLQRFLVTRDREADRRSRSS